MTRARTFGAAIALLLASGVAVAGAEVTEAEASAAAASVGHGERWESLRAYANDPTVFFLLYRSSPRLPYTAELDAKAATTQILGYLAKAGHDVAAERLTIIVFARQNGGRAMGGKASTLHLGAAIFNPRNGLVYWEPGW